MASFRKQTGHRSARFELLLAVHDVAATIALIQADCFISCCAVMPRIIADVTCRANIMEPLMALDAK